MEGMDRNCLKSLLTLMFTSLLEAKVKVFIFRNDACNNLFEGVQLFIYLLYNTHLNIQNFFPRILSKLPDEWKNSLKIEVAFFI